MTADTTPLDVYALYVFLYLVGFAAFIAVLILLGRAFDRLLRKITAALDHGDAPIRAAVDGMRDGDVARRLGGP